MIAISRLLHWAAPAIAAACLLVTPTTCAAEESKTLRVYINTSESGIDPAAASDISTLSLVENVFDPLLRYDYLARPLALQGNTAQALPQVSADGLTYTFRLRPGILFTPHAAFKGVRRELTASDYVYSIKRLYDPRIRSPWLSMFEGKILGDKALKGAEFSQDTAIAGLQAPDRYTLQIRLTVRDSNFSYYLATPATGVVAREVVEAYGTQVGNHPVGTGPFMVGEWKRSDRIVLLANPDSHAVFTTDARAHPLGRSLTGRRLPLVDRVDIKVAEEFQGRMLGFLDGQYDYIEQVPESMTSMVVTNGKLKPELARRGMELVRFPVLQTYYMWINMEAPVLGGYSKEKVALRRAIALAYDSERDIALLKQGFALRAESPLPPNVAGHDPAYRSPVQHEPALARALLDRFGYEKRDPDGFRRGPTGPLTLVMHSEATAGGRLRDELWRNSLNAIGLRVVFKTDKKSEIIKASRMGTVQMFESNWIADFPDGDNFYQLLYGPNAGRANYARFKLPAYDRLLEQSRVTNDQAERARLFRSMNQLIHAYNPWIPLTHPISADIRQPWLKNYQRHPVDLTAWRYLEIARPARANLLDAASRRQNP